jgi:16S rRNA (adenine1518-N6/adenine1519-N6)-dimethyltransferase
MAAQPITIKAVKEVLARKNLAPLKSLGQNFLVDRNFLDKIIKSGGLSREDLVLEIGPGLGGLTERLATAAGKVVAVEYDRGLYGVLRETLALYPNLQLINADFLEVDLRQILNYPEYRLKVIANLPYYITTPIIFKLLESKLHWDLMIFLVQKEVALRVAAKPGVKDYGALTVMLNFFGSVEWVCQVPKQVFYPAPQVDSAVIKITPGPTQLDWEIYPYLQQVVQASFGQRRKTVLNALGQLEPFLGAKEGLKEILLKLGINPAWRGETIGVAQYLKIAAELQKRVLEGV